MSKAKVAAVAVFAALMLSMVGAASASAATKMNWYIDGAELKAGQTAALANTATVDSPTVLNVPGLSLKVSCPGLSAKKAELQGGAAGESAMGQAEALKYESCSEVSPPSCKLSSSSTTITTEPILALVLLSSGHPIPLVSILFQPKSGNTFATISFEGSKCPFAGEQGVTGKVLVSAPTGADEAEVQAIEGLGTTENNSLIVDGDKAYLEGGKALLKLASEADWSFSTGGLDKSDEGKENFEENEEKEEKLTFEILGLPFINVIVGEPKLMYLTAPGGDTEAFKIVKDTCEGLRKEGELCHIELTFTPKGVGRYLSDLLLVVKEDGGVREELQRVMLIFNVT